MCDVLCVRPTSTITVAALIQRCQARKRPSLLQGSPGNRPCMPPHSSRAAGMRQQQHCTAQHAAKALTCVHVSSRSMAIRCSKRSRVSSTNSCCTSYSRSLRQHRQQQRQQQQQWESSSRPAATQLMHQWMLRGGMFWQDNQSHKAATVYCECACTISIYNLKPCPRRQSANPT
jgi:hypothetical protein